MEAYKETTDWGDNKCPNHTYLLDSNNLIAYIKQGELEPYFFKQPIKGFDKRGRKFEKVEPNPFNNWAKLLKAHIDVAEPLLFIKKVQGSKPNTWYEVNTDENTCTCPGYTFRGTCKHVKELACEA
jgi:hypothetical protein